MASVGFLENLTKSYGNGAVTPSTGSASTSPTASSWCSSGRPAAASRRCCA